MSPRIPCSGLWFSDFRLQHYICTCSVQKGIITQEAQLNSVESHMPFGDSGIALIVPTQPNELHNYPHSLHDSLEQCPWVTSGDFLQFLCSSPGLSEATQIIPDVHVGNRFCISSQVACLMGFNLIPATSFIAFYFTSSFLKSCLYCLWKTGFHHFENPQQSGFIDFLLILFIMC